MLCGVSISKDVGAAGGGEGFEKAIVAAASTSMLVIVVDWRRCRGAVISHSSRGLAFGQLRGGACDLPAHPGAVHYVQCPVCSILV